MNSFIKIGVVLGLVITLAACADKSKPNYQYMPNMYEAVGYETYQKVDFLPGGVEAMLPPENTINRGWLPYELENTIEGKELARLASSPLDSLQSEANLAKGAELYNIYCAICHGGTTFHTIQYGLNSMGSYASQMNTEEAWQISEYVMKLKQDLTK